MSKFNNIQTSQLLYTGRGRLHGVIVGSHTSGAIKIWDSQTAAFTVIVPTYTYATGSQTITFPPGSGSLERGIEFNTGLFITLTGVQDVTIIWEPTS